MARLIDADLMAAEETGAFISAQAQITDTATRLVNEVVHKKIQMLLADAPTIDIDRPTRSQFKRMAVQLGYEEVVHCRDCEKHRLLNGRDMCAKNAAILDGHEIFLKATRSDFFCAAGKRRTDE